MAGVEFTPMTPADVLAAQCLGRMPWVADTPQKRLALALARIARNPEPRISENQRAALWRIVDQRAEAVDDNRVLNALQDRLIAAGNAAGAKAIGRKRRERDRQTYQTQRRPWERR